MSAHLLQRLFSIKYPIIQAPMAGGFSTPNLVSSVCNSDALGFLASGYITSAALEKQIIETKAKTNKPFGVNIFLSQTVKEMEVTKQSTLLDLEKKAGIENSNKTIKVSSNEQVEEKIQLLVKHGVPIVSFTFGIPDPKIIEFLRSNKIYIMGTATNIREALLLEKANVDAVCLQGTEAGAHRGSIEVKDQSDEVGLLSLLQVAQAKLKIPYIATGGIATGQSMLSCRILGASAVQIGTAFILTHECEASAKYKNTLLSYGGQDTVVTDVITGRKARGIKNEIIEKMNQSSSKGEPILDFPIQNALSKDIRGFAGQKGLSQYQSLWCGQSLECLKQQSVEEFIQNIIKDYEQSIKSIQQLNLI